MNDTQERIIALLEEDDPEADLACCGFPENWRYVLESEIR